jgi:hypothetical protein
MNARYVLKLEDTLLEQTYKFRDGQIESVDQLRNLVTEDFYEACLERFEGMRTSQDALFSPLDDESFEFDVII